uniref:Uncharacterized protein n=1 Tax=Pararge aegeria TaxID=116150 RepID=S4PIQ4_9NEOP
MYRLCKIKSTLSKRVYILQASKIFFTNKQGNASVSIAKSKKIPLHTFSFHQSFSLGNCYNLTSLWILP